MKENLVEIWRQLLRGLPRNLWFTISTTSSYEYNLQAATSLNLVEYETILLASGIMVKKGDTTVYSYGKLEYLQGILRGRLDIHICRSKIDRNGIPLYFMAVERPTFRNPSLQGKAEDLRVLPNRHGNGLDEERVRLLECLRAERASTNEPELIVDERFPPPPQIEEQRKLLSTVLSESNSDFSRFPSASVCSVNDKGSGSSVESKLNAIEVAIISSIFLPAVSFSAVGDGE
jgi:hypothetical protein